MKTKALLVSCAATLLFAPLLPLSAATIPAGTILTVRTLRAVSSVDAPGTAIRTQLQQPVTVNGKIVIPAGTEIAGKVVTSARMMSTNSRLTVNLTRVHLGHGEQPITTTGAQPLSNDLKTRNGVGISRRDYTVAAGKQMQFKLAQPLVY